VAKVHTSLGIKSNNMASSDMGLVKEKLQTVLYALNHFMKVLAFFESIGAIAPNVFDAVESLETLVASEHEVATSSKNHLENWKTKKSVERKSTSPMSVMSVSRSTRIRPSSSQRPASGRRVSRRPQSASSSSRFRSRTPRQDDELSLSSMRGGRPMSASGAFRRSSGASSRGMRLSSRAHGMGPGHSSSQQGIASASPRGRRADVEQFSPSPYPYSYSVMSHTPISGQKKSSGDRKSRNLMQLGTLESQMDDLRIRMGLRVPHGGHFCPTEAVPVEPRRPQTMSKMMDSIHGVIEGVTTLVKHVKFESEKVDQFRKRLRKAEKDMFNPENTTSWMSCKIWVFRSITH
jgi:hypothetical protein